jgi:penicillin-binding protein 2
MIEPGEAKQRAEPARAGPGKYSIVPAPPETSARRGDQPHSWRVEPLSAVEGGFLHSSAFYLRCTIAGVVALAVFATLGLRLWSLQVVQGGRYGAVAREQAERSVELALARAPIVDARGRVLAGSQARLAIGASLAALGERAARGWRLSRHGHVVLARLASAARLPLPKILSRIRASARLEPLAPALVVPHASSALADYLLERRTRFPGLEVVSLPERSYPQGALGAPFLGLLGEAGKAEIGKRVRLGETVGTSGIERVYDRVVNPGLARGVVPVDALGNLRGGVRLVRPPRRAHGLGLTIDARLQRAADRAIRLGIRLAHEAGHKDAHAGAAVVMSPSTGAIRALASVPSFNQAAAAHSPAYLERLLRGRAGSATLVNRAIQGLYPAGSTFKPIVAEAALGTGILSPTESLPCTGSLTVGGRVFHNFEPGAHAWLTLPQALATSCDTWFYRLGLEFYDRGGWAGLGIQRWARRLGIGHRTGIDLPGEAGGLLPTPAWLARTFRSRDRRIWYPGNSVNLAIGQGYLAVTPLQLAVAYAALANGGRVLRPHLARAIVGDGGEVLHTFRLPARARVQLHDVWAIRTGLYAATHDPSGTSSAIFARFPVAVAGKTGTAQAPAGSDHSWFASWAPAWRPRVVVVVLIEHGGFGAVAAAPAARAIYQALFPHATKSGAHGA